MKTRFFITLKSIIRDRPIFLLVLSLLGAMLAYSIYVTLSLEPTELQVAMRYTAFGETHFYRNQWHYALNFIVFAVMFTVLHIAIIARLLRDELRVFALAVGCLSVVLFVLLVAYTHSVLSIAFLS